MKLLVTASVMILMSAPAFAGDVTAGKAKTGMCVACHGKDGIATIAGYPNLAGQNAQYLVSAMKSYKSKERKGGQSAVMYGMVAGLSEDDMKNIAAYYASLK